MPEQDLHFWYFNESWYTRWTHHRVGHIETEEEAARLSAKEHLIVFQASIEEVTAVHLY